jgi:hypothetical protein
MLRLPMGPLQVPGAGFVHATAGSLVWDKFLIHIKKIQRWGGALALGGRRFLNIYNNQMEVGVGGWVIYWGGRAAGVEHTGGHSAIVLAVQLIGKNIIKKIYCGLRWPPINVFDSTTNQKHTGVMEEVQGKRFGGGVAWGNGNAIILGAIKLGRGVKR